MPTRTPRRRARRPKKVPRPPSPHAVRRSIWLARELFTEIVTLAKQEERKPSDMIRILLQRGLRSTRAKPPPPAS
jgi:hypothetical protein